MKKWKQSDPIEIRAFVGLLLTAGRLSQNNASVYQLWDKLYGPSVFKATMSQDRFQRLSMFIRFDDAESRSIRRWNNKLAPIRDI